MKNKWLSLLFLLLPTFFSSCSKARYDFDNHLDTVDLMLSQIEFLFYELDTGSRKVVLNANQSLGFYAKAKVKYKGEKVF